MTKPRPKRDAPKLRLELYVPPKKQELIQKFKKYAKQNRTSVSAILLRYATYWVRQEEIRQRKERRQ